ncbi:MAG: gamma-glutamylcyclotransferase [Clostridiales Family XIII bacterium]|jgi:hypothetical protein|nr:gamma-glutamylcyclotransferase [Clostridiales Family XIII bacterium]
MSESKIYAAYGSNLNVRQMRMRCPYSRLVCTGFIDKYELQFKGSSVNAHATIGAAGNAKAHVALWEITDIDELNLDRYEGFPHYYYKEDLTVTLESGEEIGAMAYIMDQSAHFGVPSVSYLSTLIRGYEDCGLDMSYLRNALESSMKMYGSRLLEEARSLYSGFGDVQETGMDDAEPEDEDEDIILIAQ